MMHNWTDKSTNDINNNKMTQLHKINFTITTTAVTILNKLNNKNKWQQQQQRNNIKTTIATTKYYRKLTTLTV